MFKCTRCGRIYTELPEKLKCITENCSGGRFLELSSRSVIRRVKAV